MTEVTPAGTRNGCAGQFAMKLKVSVCALAEGGAARAASAASELAQMIEVTAGHPNHFPPLLRRLGRMPRLDCRAAFFAGFSGLEFIASLLQRLLVSRDTNRRKSGFERLATVPSSGAKAAHAWIDETWFARAAPGHLKAVIKQLMGAASLGLGVAGIVKPGLFVRLTGAERNEARGLGFRDLLVGIGIFAAPRVGLAQRAVADVGDSIVFARRKPVVVPLALASAALAAFGATRA